jgi:hypothetical protein
MRFEGLRFREDGSGSAWGQEVLSLEEDWLSRLGLLMAEWQ